MTKFNHPFNEEASINRLLHSFRKHNQLIIGFDFDNTIYDTHNCGGDFSCVINLLKTCSSMGFTMCLWTLEPDKEKLKWKEKYVQSLGIHVDYVNESPILKGGDKPFFNILLDDRAGLESAYNILNKTVNRILKSLIHNALNKTINKVNKSDER